MLSGICPDLLHRCLTSDSESDSDNSGDIDSAGSKHNVPSPPATINVQRYAQTGAVHPAKRGPKVLHIWHTVVCDAQLSPMPYKSYASSNWDIGVHTQPQPRVVLREYLYHQGCSSKLKYRYEKDSRRSNYIFKYGETVYHHSFLGPTQPLKPSLIA